MTSLLGFFKAFIIFLLLAETNPKQELKDLGFSEVSLTYFTY